MYKKLKTQSNDLIVVEIPEDARDISKMDECNISYRHNFDYEDVAEFSHKNILHHQDVVKGKSFKILGKLSELKDKDLEKFVEYSKKGLTNEDTWRDYGFDEWEECFSIEESFISLLQLNGIDINKKNLLIIEVL